MAETERLPPLSNMDIIKLSKNIGRDEHYRLGKVLGFAEDILDHLWDADQKGCTLQILLLWRDGLQAEDDQRAILAEKLAEAGLEDKRDHLLHGFPLSPGPYPPSPSYSTTDMTAPPKNRERNNNDPSVGMGVPVQLPIEQSTKSDQEPHPFARGSDKDASTPGNQSEQSNEERTSGGSHDTEVSLSDPRHSSRDEDSDSSDPENYINVSNKTLQYGSVSVALVRSKPRLSFHNPVESTVSEQRQSLFMETGPLISPSSFAVHGTKTKEDSQRQLGGISIDDQEAVHQSNTTEDLATSEASSRVVSSGPVPVGVKPTPHKPTVPYFQFKEPTHQNTNDQSSFPSSQGEITLPHSQGGSVEDPTKGCTGVSPKPPLPRSKPNSLPLGLDPQNKNQQIAPSPFGGTETLVDLQYSKGPDELPKSETVAPDASSAGEMDECNQHAYASIGMDVTKPQQKTQGPPVAPYKPKTSVPAFHQDASKEAAEVPCDRKRSLQEPSAMASKPPPRRVSVKPKPVTTNDAGSSLPVHHTVNEDVLRALANDIRTGEHLGRLGQELGFQETEINGFEAMNQRTTPQSMQGTLQMLLEWRSKVSSEDQALLLKHALRRSGLEKTAVTHLNASKRRRDIRNIKIAKHFTVSDCREKLEFHYRIDTCKVLKKLEFLTAGNHLPVISVHRLVKHGKTLHVEKVLLQGSIHDILRTRKDDALPTRIVIFGPPGVGKTTLLAQLAHDWAERVEGSPLQDVSLLFVLKMKFLNNHGSLGQAIVNQLLSDVRGLTPQGIDQFIEDNQSECLVLLDGLDEFKGEVSSVKCGHVLRVIQNIQLRKCRVIVTSHPRLEDYFNKEDLPNDFLKMELRGFSQLQSTSFVRSFFRENRLHKADELIVFLRMNCVIKELMAIPLFCLLVCHLWESNLLQLVTTESEFYDSVNRFFLKHGEEKASTGAGDTDLESIVPGVGEVALNGFLEDPNKRAFGQSDFKKIPSMFEKACALGIISKGTSNRRDDAIFEFYHRNAQEHCAAKYLSREAPSKSTKGKNSRMDKGLKQMAKRNLADYGGILRFTAGLGSHSNRLQVVEAIHSAENVQSGDKSRIVLDCLAEIPELDKQTSYAVERCFEGGNILLNLPTIHTTLGFYKLHPHVKEKLRSVKILSSSMPSHVGKSLSMGLQGCPDLLKLEVADVHNPTYPIILLLANKLSLHMSPEGALSVLSDLNQIVFNGLRLVNLSGCYLSPEATTVLWTTLARCPHIEVMTIKGTTILGRDLPRLRCVAVVQANLSSPVHQEEVQWLSSLLGDAQDSTEMRLTIGDTMEGTIRRAGVGLQEHILIAKDRLDLTNATGNTIKVLSVLPDNYRKKVKTLCIKRTRFTEDLTRPLLESVHSLIRLETFTTEDCNLPDELKQLQVFKGSFQRHAHELPTLGPDGVFKGRVSSPIREEEFERLNSALTGTTSIQQVHLLIEHDRPSETDYQELLDITGDNMELCNVSSATIEILRILPTSFKQQIHSARIRNCNLTDELSQLLSDTLQSMGELEMFLSENSILAQKALHLRSVTVLKLGCFSSKCFDWEWLENALLLEELHLTFASSAPITPTSPMSFSLPVMPTTPTSPTSPKGAGAGAATLIARSGSVDEDLPNTSEASAARETSNEDFFLQLTYGRLVMNKMSSCSLSVMLHLPKHVKNELRHVRIRSTKLTVDLLNQLADVRRSFKHLASLSLESLYRRPIKYGCILQPDSSNPVVGQWD